MPALEKPWTLPPEEVMKALGTSPEGLTWEEVERRQREGKNVIYAYRAPSFPSIFLSQFRQPLLLLLMLAGFLSLALHEVLESAFIFFAVFLSAFFSAYLEWKGAKAVEELRRFSSLSAVVVREGKEVEVKAEDVVVGDVIVLKDGMVVPADAVLIEGSLKVDESSLTGESEPVEKEPGVSGEEASVYERKNMVFASTRVLEGYAKAVVVAVGKATEMGRIASLIEEGKAKTPMEERVERLSKHITFLAVLVVALTFFIGLLQGRDVEELFLFSIVLAVAAIPEGLTTVMTMILGLGAREMAKRKALVRNLSAIDTLGSVDVIVSDKTGTLTYGEPRVVEVVAFSLPKEKVLLYAYYASTIGEEGKGDDVEEAILKALGKARRVKREVVVPFSSDRKYMCVRVGRQCYWKGAPEVMLEKAAFIGRKPVEEAKEEFLALLHQLEAKGLRVIAVGVGKEGKMVIVGLLALGDALREEAPSTVRKARKLGVEVIMVTGDSKLAALHIAKALGLSSRAVEWRELESLHDDELYEVVLSTKVIARATPESKYRIVRVLQEHSHVVAVTGDGVNDAPALKRAHIGVAMGRRGTAVAREVADLILLDDNLATLIEAIKYGRNIFFNIANFIRFQLTTTISAITITLWNFLAFLPYPFTAIQLVWINLFMDGPPAIAQAFEKPKKEVEESKPIRKKDFLAPPRLWIILYIALFMAFVVEAIFAKRAEPFTLAFNTFVFMQLANALNARSVKEPFYKELSKNPFLVVSVVGMALLQLFINLHPGLAAVFSLSPMPLRDWAVVAGSFVLVLALDELRKRVGVWVEE